MHRRDFLGGGGRLLILTVACAWPAAARAAGIADMYILPRAAENNDLDGVQQILIRGDVVDTEGQDDRAALSFAAANGNMAIANILLAHFANPDHRDRFGNTALHWAAANGHAEMIKRLLAAKASIDLQNKSGGTPLMLAIGSNRREAVRTLVQAGANLKIQDFTGHDALSWAQGKPAIMALLKQGAP